MRALVLLGASLVTLACGGDAVGKDTTSGGSASLGGASGASPNGGAQSGGVVNGGSSSLGGGTTSTLGSCPASLPAEGQACPANLICSYGDSPDFACRQVAQCDSGRWQITQPGCEIVQPDACPASQPENATACSAGDQSNLLCRYGIEECVCHTCTRFDYCPASVTAGWLCQAPATRVACPAAPPNAGTACTFPGKQCSYGFPCINQATLICDAGVWSLGEGEACPH